MALNRSMNPLLNSPIARAIQSVEHNQTNTETNKPTKTVYVCVHHYTAMREQEKCNPEETKKSDQTKDVYNVEYKRGIN